MLRELLKGLATALGTPYDACIREEKGKFKLHPGKGLELELQEEKPHLLIKTTLGPVPAARKEELFSLLMHANVLGQGTGGSAIGMDAEEKFLTLGLSLSYEIDLREFKERIEEFANYTVYWQEALNRFNQETAESILS